MSSTYVIFCHIFAFSVELRRLSGDILQLGQKLEGVKALSQSTSSRVNATHEDALGVFSDIFALILPDINVPKLKEDADIAKREVICNSFKSFHH